MWNAGMYDTMLMRPRCKILMGRGAESVLILPACFAGGPYVILSRGVRRRGARDASATMGCQNNEIRV